MEETFSPASIPASLPPALLSHFSTNKAYTLHKSIPFLLHSLRSSAEPTYSTTLIGVVSNSDPRVPSILRSLGIKVKSYAKSYSGDTGGKNGSVDFVTVSYDVGFEKPDPRIFDAALETAKKLAGPEEKEWVKVHIGDDYEKDFQGAKNAGWTGLIWDGETKPEQVLKNILAG